MSSQDSSKKITIGRIGEPFGVKGWSHLFSFTDPANNIFNYTNWQIRAYKKKEAQWKPVEIEFHKPHGGDFVIKFKGYDDRDQALLLKNHTIAVDRADLPALGKDEYYWDDLIGLQVISTTGKSFGEIDYLFEAGPNEIIATKILKEAHAPTRAQTGTQSKSHTVTHYIPYTKDVVKSVDLTKKIMVVEWEAIE